MTKVIDLDLTRGHPSEDTENTAVTSNASPLPPSFTTVKRSSGPKKTSDPTGSPMASAKASPTGDGEFECDFDTNATTLYKLLDSSDWKKAAERIKTHPNEVKTWIIRHNKDNEIVWKLLPLHAAILFQSPESVSRPLLEKYPKAASRGDDRKMLPLHLAFRQKEKDEVLLEMLLVHYPKGVHVKDQRGKVPLEYCKEAQFSAKLMRLYADASVAGAKTPTVVGPGAVTTGQASTKAKVEDEKEKDNYEEKLTTLISFHEDRIQHILEKNKIDVDALREENESLKQRLEESNDKLESLAKRKHDENESAKSKQKAEEMKSELEMLRVLLKGTKLYNEELTSSVKEIVKDQERLQDMIVEQQEELEAARAMRKQLLMTLVQQEDEDQVSFEQQGKEALDLAEKISDRIEKVLARAPPAEPAANSNRGNDATKVAKEQQLQQPPSQSHQHDDISAITDISNFH